MNSQNNVCVACFVAGARSRTRAVLRAAIAFDANAVHRGPCCADYRSPLTRGLAVADTEMFMARSLHL